MKDDLFTYLHDIREAGLAIKAFIAGKTFADYRNDDLLRSAVERKFEIVGEALSRIMLKDGLRQNRLTVFLNTLNYN